MGEHDAPESWLDRWREAEPLRLYLWTIATAVIVLAGVAGWLTAELAVAVTGLAAAVLMVGGTALARRQTFAPLTVERLQARWVQETDQLLDEQHALSFEQGGQSVLQAVQETQRTPDQVAEQLRTGELEATSPHPRVQPPDDYRTTAMAAVRACPFRDAAGRRCVLAEHPNTWDHELEGVSGKE